MKFGPLYLTWRTDTEKFHQRQFTMSYLRSDPQVRELLAKMARSEVKNYLARLAEEAEVPFVSPAGFLYGIRAHLARISLTNVPPADDGEVYDQEADVPFTVIRGPPRISADGVAEFPMVMFVHCACCKPGCQVVHDLDCDAHPTGVASEVPANRYFTSAESCPPFETVREHYAHGGTILDMSGEQFAALEREKETNA